MHTATHHIDKIYNSRVCVSQVWLRKAAELEKTATAYLTYQAMVFYTYSSGTVNCNASLEFGISPDRFKTANAKRLHKRGD
jgi:hypothetical protein